MKLGNDERRRSRYETTGRGELIRARGIDGDTNARRCSPSATRRQVLAAGIATALAGVWQRPAAAETMANVVLLGDSTLDNAAYVAAGQSVSEQLQHLLPAGSRATLRARDGDVTAGIASQLRGLPHDATHLVVSVGGNDALRESGVLSEPARSMAEALGRLSAVQDGFSAAYRAMLDVVAAQRVPVAICTIYNAAFPDQRSRRIAATALSVLNDVITREAGSRGLSLIDLRSIVNSDADYANAIEPSAEGGRKFAAAIAAFAAGGVRGGRSEIIVGP